MTKTKPFSLMNYEYKFILSELRPLIQRCLHSYNINTTIFGIKLLSRADNIASILVLTNSKTLWSFKYCFLNPENWQQHELQSSARLVESDELNNLRTSFMEIQGMTSAEADEACFKFFIESSSCLQKEELKNLKTRKKNVA